MQQQQLDLANQLVGQNVPIENIVQQTGLPRELITDLVNSQLVINRPDSSFQSPQGIGSLQLDSGIPQFDMTENLGTDIADYLTDELGFDGTDDDSNLTSKQMLNAANAAWMINNQDDTEGARKLLEVQKLAEDMDFDDEELEDLFGRAAQQVYDFDYEQFIQKPDKSLPLMMAGLAIAEGGTKGENWPTVLSDAFLRYAFTKKKDERAYDAQIKEVGLKKQEKINELVMDFKLLDYKNKAALNLALQKSKLEAPKAYDVSNTGDFTDKQTVFLNDAEFAGYSKILGQNIRPGENANKEAWSMVSRDGGILNVLLDQDDVNAWDPDNNDGAVLRKGHSEPTNVKLYQIKGKDGEDLGSKWLSPAQYNFRVEQGESLDEIKGTGKPNWVIDKSSGEGIWVSDATLFSNPTAYMDDSGFSISVGADGTIEATKGSGADARANQKRGNVAYDEILEGVNAAETAYTNYFTSVEEQDKLLKDFLTANPGAENLPFNNFAGTAINFVKGIVLNAKEFAKLATQDYGNGGYSFYDNNGNKVSYEKYKLDTIASDDFQNALNSPFAQFLLDNGVARDELEATMFDLAMQGAASYSPNKGGVDLRAISDFETKKFLQLQGGEASTLGSFISIRNRFARNLIRRNKDFLKQQIRPTNLLRITGKDGLRDETKVQAIQSDVEDMLKQLEEYESQYQQSYTYGMADSLAGPKTFVKDGSVDSGNPDVVEYNPKINPGLFVSSANFTFTNPYNLETQTEEGTFRDILNKYEVSLLDKSGAKTTALLDNLQANLSPEEFLAFRVFLLKRPNRGQ